MNNTPQHHDNKPSPTVYSLAIVKSQIRVQINRKAWTTRKLAALDAKYQKDNQQTSAQMNHRHD